MGLELDEYLYAKILKYLKRRRLNNTEVLSRQIILTDVKPRLTLLATAICGASIEIFPAEREGGYKNNNFFLPVSCSLFATKQDNLQFYIFRTVYLSVQKQLHLNWQNQEQSPELSSEKAIETAPLVLEKMFADYPVLQQWYDRTITRLPVYKKNQARDYSWIYGKWMKNTPENERKDALQNFDDTTKNVENKIEAKTTLYAKAVEEIESLTIDKKQQEDYVLMHSFEKIETAEEFNGSWRDFDGKDDLKNHQEALEDMNMRFTVRVDDTVHSVYQADFIENTSIAESAEIDDKGFHLRYDEWDFKNRAYLSGFCKVYPKIQVKTRVDYYKNTMAKYKTTLNGLRKMLTSVNNKMQQQRKQLQGEAFDLDALTDLYTDIHSNISPDERIYLSQRKKEKDIAI